MSILTTNINQVERMVEIKIIITTRLKIFRWVKRILFWWGNQTAQNRSTATKTINQLEQQVNVKSKNPKNLFKQIYSNERRRISIEPCVRHQNGETSVNSRLRRFSNQRSVTGINKTNESTIANEIVKIDTDCLFKSVIINTQIVNIFPNKPTQIIMGVTRINKFCVNVPSSNSNSFNVQLLVMLIDENFSFLLLLLRLERRFQRIEDRTKSTSPWWLERGKKQMSSTYVDEICFLD